MSIDGDKSLARPGAIRRLRGLSIVLLLALGGMASADGDSPADCAARGPVDHICGLRNAEDLERIDGTPWVLAGQLVANRGGPGGFYAVNARNRSVVPVAPDFSRPADRRYAGCPGAPRPELFAAHGIALQRGGREVYAVNHGGRESVEIFDLDMRAATPTLVWKGCVIVPDAVAPNAVTPLPDGGLAVTSFGERTDKDSFAKMAAGQRTGFVAAWSPKTGWSEVPGSRLAAPNGIAASADGRTLYVTGWGDGTLHLLPWRRSGQPRSVALDGLRPDNIRVAPDGGLLIAGQAATASAVLGCGRQRVCEVASRVLKVDPATLEATTLADVPGSPVFGGASVALLVDGRLWLGSFRGDRIAVVAPR